ncbi:MAG: hypothetical protein J7J61_09585 [Candidatus Hydrothermae bacterium]|nr:hypothetical protein [Candidatus Hydrothermae bacterium]
MVTYDDVKTKAVNLRKKILSDLAMKRIDIAKSVYDNVKAKLQYILTEIQNNVSYASRFNVHRYSVESYITSLANELGSKAVSVQYNDSTETVNGYDIPTFDRFSYDETDYLNKLKNLGTELAKDVVKLAIPNSESPPQGDIEDAIFTYYIASDVNVYSDMIIADEIGKLPEYAEFGIYGLDIKRYDIKAITGELKQFLFDIAGITVQVWIVVNATVRLFDVDVQKEFRVNAKLYLDVVNPSSYDVYVCVLDSKFIVGSNWHRAYLQFADVKLMPSPVIIRDESL